MHFSEHKLFEILTSCSWDSGTGRKMLFLKRRYYVFDDDHKLLDGGVIRYNKTLEKIFIRNEDLRGEVFLSLEGEKLHLQGAVYSKLAGQINIDNILTKYSKQLKAPLSRVAKVEKYLSITDIFEILHAQKHINERYLHTYEKSLHAFSPDQARMLYIKLSPSYFQHFKTAVLKTICLYFSTTPSNHKQYEELFMFLMGMQTAYEHKFIKAYDIEYFISAVKDKLLKTYKEGPSSISKNMINESLLYFKIPSSHLPSPQECIAKLYHHSLEVQKEHAFYLSLMTGQVKEVENDILQRLISFYQEKFFLFKQKIKGENPTQEHLKKMVTELSTQLALIQALGSCKSENKEVHIFLLFLLSNHENKIKNAAKNALLIIKDKALHTFKSLNIKKENMDF